MSVYSTKIVNDLISHFRYIDQTRKKADTLFQRRKIVRRDIDIIYAGLFLEIMTSFEGFIEELFLRLLVDDRCHPSNAIKAKFSFRNLTESRQIVCAGRNYIDWFPYEYTIKRAKLYLKSGRPFTDLDSNDKKILEEILIIRNAVAHKSKYAIKRFRNSITDNLPLLTNKEKTVNGFLRSNYRSNPNENRYQYYVGQLAYLALKLAR